MLTMNKQTEIDRIVQNWIQENNMNKIYSLFCQYVQNMRPDDRITFWPPIPQTFINGMVDNWFDRIKGQITKNCIETNNQLVDNINKINI